MGTLIQDLRFALRNLRKTPAFPLAAVGTLALGIGATTAIFSTVNAALLRPLPYAQAQDLYSVRTTLTDGRPTTGLVSPVEVLRLNDSASSIVHVAGMQSQSLTLLRDDGTPLKIDVYGVSEGFFELFGLPMTVGPGLTPDKFVPNAPPTVVISYRVWQDMFGGDPAVVGKQVRFVEITATIGGVAPRDFDTPHGAGFWFGQPFGRQDVNHSFEGYMRVRPGADLNRVRGEMAGVMAGLAKDFPVSDVSRAYVVRPLVDSIVGDLGPILIIVLSATALLLVLACVNVTNLLLARGASRAKEVAIRVALGASRGRIVRQLLTESIVLAAAGALVGLAVAASGVRALLALGAGKLPRLDEVPFDSHVLLFALVVLFASGVLVGFAPALRLATSDTKTLMNDSTRSSTGGRGTMRWLNAMTIAEIALAITLVAGAGWLVRGFANLRTTNPGFVADGRVIFDVSFQSQKYRDQAVAAAAEVDLLQRLRTLSGVSGAGATSNFPLRGTQENSLYLQLHGEVPEPRAPKGTRQRFISPGFFDAMGIKMIAGRDFTDADRVDSMPVAIVNRTFARNYLTGMDPLLARFAAGYPTIDPRNEVAIVGIVDDVRQKTLSDAPEPAYYSPLAQAPGLRRQTVVVKTGLSDPTPLQAAIREDVRQMDPQIAVDFDSASALVASTLRRQELGMTLMLVFGLTAVALAAVGIYGVIAYATAQRSGEVATRLALGATPGHVFWLVLGQGRTLTLIGGAIGVVLAYLGGRIISSRLYEVQASDPIILGAATLVVIFISVVATTIPAYRASRIDPSRVLRSD